MYCSEKQHGRSAAADYFIATRAYETLRRYELANKYQVKVIPGVNDPVFGE